MRYPAHVLVVLQSNTYIPSLLPPLEGRLPETTLLEGSYRCQHDIFAPENAKGNLEDYVVLLDGFLYPSNLPEHIVDNSIRCGHAAALYVATHLRERGARVILFDCVPPKALSQEWRQEFPRINMNGLDGSEDVVNAFLKHIQQ